MSDFTPPMHKFAVNFIEEMNKNSENNFPNPKNWLIECFKDDEDIEAFNRLSDLQKSIFSHLLFLDIFPFEIEVSSNPSFFLNIFERNPNAYFLFDYDHKEKTYKLLKNDEIYDPKDKTGKTTPAAAYALVIPISKKMFDKYVIHQSRVDKENEIYHVWDEFNTEEDCRKNMLSENVLKRHEERRLPVYLYFDSIVKLSEDAFKSAFGEEAREIDRGVVALSITRFIVDYFSKYNIAGIMAECVTKHGKLLAEKLGMTFSKITFPADSNTTRGDAGEKSANKGGLKDYFAGISSVENHRQKAEHLKDGFFLSYMTYKEAKDLAPQKSYENKPTHESVLMRHLFNIDHTLSLDELQYDRRYVLVMDLVNSTEKCAIVGMANWSQRFQDICGWIQNNHHFIEMTSFKMLGDGFLISAYNFEQLFLLACEFIQKVKENPIIDDDEEVATPVSIAIGRAKRNLIVYKNFDIGGDQVVKVFRLESDKYNFDLENEVKENREWRLRIDGHVHSKLRRINDFNHLSEDEVKLLKLARNKPLHPRQFGKYGNEYGQPEIITVCDIYF